MPELPTVEGARNHFEKHFKNVKIENAFTNFDERIFLSKTENLENAFKGNYIHSVERWGKWMWICLVDEKDFEEDPENKFKNKTCIILHLGMSGTFIVQTPDENQRPNEIKTTHVQLHIVEKEKQENGQNMGKTTKFILNFENNTTLVFTDTRRLGKIQLLDEGVNPRNVKPISELGFDPIHSMISKEDFFEIILKKQKPIKALLLDQEFSAGIGNEIADEILYQSYVHPEQICSTLTEDEIQKIFDNIKSICFIAAITHNGEEKNFPKEWLFHYRGISKEVKKDFENNDVLFVKIGGRTSSYVAQRQVLRKTQKQNQKENIKKRKLDDENATISNKKKKSE